jgi:hypothetical protein
MAQRPGLYANIHAKRRRVAASKGKLRMRKKGEKGAPTDAQFKAAAKTAKRNRKRGKGLLRG